MTLCIYMYVTVCLSVRLSVYFFYVCGQKIDNILRGMSRQGVRTTGAGRRHVSPQLNNKSRTFGSDHFTVYGSD